MRQPLPLVSLILSLLILTSCSFSSSKSSKNIAPDDKKAQILSISCGNHHSLAVYGNGSVFSWGRNIDGELGLGGIFGSSFRSVPTKIPTISAAVSVACGPEYSVAVTQNGTAYIFGNSVLTPSSSTLIKAKSYPVILSHLPAIRHVSAGFDTMFTATDGSLYILEKNKTSPKKFSAIRDVAMTAIGTNHYLALKKDGMVWVWGSNADGIFGNNKITQEKINTPQPIESLKNIKTVASGSNHALALTSDGKVYAWGLNTFGQLGDGTTNHHYTPIPLPFLENIASIACGADYSLAVSEKGTLYAWGLNNSGQLGLGHTHRQLTITKVPISSKIVTVSAGTQHTMAVSENQTLYIWGFPGYGKLGIGEVKDIAPVTSPRAIKLPSE